MARRASVQPKQGFESTIDADRSDDMPRVAKGVVDKDEIECVRQRYDHLKVPCPPANAAINPSSSNASSAVLRHCAYPSAKQMYRTCSMATYLNTVVGQSPRSSDPLNTSGRAPSCLSPPCLRNEIGLMMVHKSRSQPLVGYHVKRWSSNTTLNQQPQKRDDRESFDPCMCAARALSFPGRLSPNAGVCCRRLYVPFNDHTEYQHTCTHEVHQRTAHMPRVISI